MVPLSRSQKKSFSAAFKITVVLFVFFSVLFLWFQVQQKSQVINQKIQIDKELLVDALKIGDLFFITKYIASFVDSGSTPFAGIILLPENEWVASSSVESKVSENERLKLSVGFFSTQVPIVLALSDNLEDPWKLVYVLKINHSFLFNAFMISAAICLLIFFFLRKMLSTTSFYFTAPIENLVKDLSAQKKKSQGELLVPSYYKGHQFKETDILVQELRSLLREIEIQQEEMKKIEIYKALNRLSRQVSHDIQSPLGALKAATENLGNNPEASSKLVKKAVERIEAIISDLEIKKNKDHRDTKVKVNMSKFLSSLVEEKRLEYNSSDKPEVIFDFVSYDNDIECKINENQIARAISNVINNGIEAVDDKVAQIKVRLTKDEDCVVIEVLDNGKGISSENMEKVFDYGYTSGKVNGSGTGLSFAKKIIEEHAGEVHFISIKDAGSRVSFVINRDN